MVNLITCYFLDDSLQVKRVKLCDQIDGGCISTENSISTKTKNNNATFIQPLLSAPSFDFKLFNGGGRSWTESQLLSEIQNIDQRTSHNIIKLFNDDNTIPFMYRYRRELIGDLTPDQ